MPTLKINQNRGRAEGVYHIGVGVEDIPGLQSQSVGVEIKFALLPQDREYIRWYLEDYLQFHQDPAPTIAKRVEQRMSEIGDKLFREIFQGSDDARDLWAALRPHLSDTRIEVTTGIAEATAIPWELIRDPRTKTPLVLSAVAFVRGQPGAVAALAPREHEATEVRILLVICRPKAGEDVPFRSVAGRLVTRLNEAARETLDLDVLRPPTFERLAEVLRLAKEQGRPYHVVHFDGHGVYADPETLANAGETVNALQFKTGSTGRCGFVMFENPKSKTNAEFVDGFKLGKLLTDNGVPLLVLNACQSAFAEAPAEPAPPTSAARGEIEAYGSLAQAVMDGGAAGVVAMRYAVYVVTAAQFVAELYAALARGRALGEAVAAARKNLADKPERQIAYEARPLHDWSVPVVWERAPLRLWPENTGAAPITVTQDEAAAAQPGALDAALPARPDVGFYGRDETLRALDRAFDSHSIVLLHAYAGSGKTATSAEFARWYALTGGIDGPVLFTSFERHLPLARVLDKIGEVFGHDLAGSGVEWDAITDTSRRRQIALQVLKQIPVLWIWDNVEPVTGFPAGTESAWSAEEQRELHDFLAAARETQAKFLLTSRRDEAAWLGQMPVRAHIPPMPMLERLQLAGAIAEHQGKRLADLPDLRDLLRFTGGNPLTLLVTVGQALRDGIATDRQLEAFLAGLRSGQASFDDEESEGRSRSLGASLSYGFEHGFDEADRRVLALLHLFQGVVSVEVLSLMGNVDADWCLEAVRGMTREHGIALLDRAADVGLLTALGGGYYRVHPALPWYFRGLFDRHYPVATGDADRARRAFVVAMAGLGIYIFNQYNTGNRGIVATAAAVEDNLLAAWRLARAQGESEAVIGAMQGLRNLYDDTGRGAAWRRLVEAVVPDFVDPATDGARPGIDHEAWLVVMGYRVALARRDREGAEAERLQRLLVNFDRNRAQPLLAAAPETLGADERNAIRSLAVTFCGLGQIQREAGQASCADWHRESLRAAEAIGNTALQAVCANELGLAYKVIPGLRDLDEAERWYRRSLDLTAPSDTLGRGICLLNLGNVAQERFQDARAAQRPADELTRHLTEALKSYEQALDLLPEHAVKVRGTTHNGLGNLFKNIGDIDRALDHYRQSIRNKETAGNTFAAGLTRFNVALALLRADRLADARSYAVAALANYKSFGDRAADHIQRTQGLIQDIDEAAAEQGSGG